jgi:hypothetical protein
VLCFRVSPRFQPRFCSNRNNSQSFVFNEFRTLSRRCHEESTTYALFYIVKTHLNPTKSIIPALFCKNTGGCTLPLCPDTSTFRRSDVPMLSYSALSVPLWQGFASNPCKSVPNRCKTRPKRCFSVPNPRTALQFRAKQRIHQLQIDFAPDRSSLGISALWRE